MQYLGLLFDLALLGVNLWGFTLVAGFCWRNRWFALATGPILAVTMVYGVECLQGLGPSLKVFGLLGTALSASLIALSGSPWEPTGWGSRWAPLVRAWRQEFAPRELRLPFAVFGGIFLYTFLWRFIHPDINGFSEKIADLSYICSYLTGATIPVPDAWFMPYPSVQYYSFQHYGAALMGRLLILSPGTTYNIGFCLLIALSGSAFAGAVFLVAQKAWVRALLVCGFIFGGMGMSLLVHLTDVNTPPTESWRFIGSAAMNKPPLGPWLKAYNLKHALHDPDGTPRMMDLPGEPFAYSIYLGDYHAPLSGYYLMGIGVMAAILWARTRLVRYPMIVGGTLTWVLLANPWVLPLQGLAALGWLAVNWRDWRRLVFGVGMGAAAVWLVTQGFLSNFTSSASDYHTSFVLVPPEYHTPPLLLLLMFLPTIALIILGFASGNSKGLWLAGLWLSLLVVSEYVYVKDVYSGMYARFNTTLKWWPWVASGALMTLGPVVLEQARWRWVRIVGIVFCLYPCFYVLDLWRPFRDRVEGSPGHLEGSAYLTKDEASRLMLARLRLEKPGIVVEHPDKAGGFTDSAVLPLFAGHSMWLGWFGHEGLWRGHRRDIDIRHAELMQLYGAPRADAGHWLYSQGIDYILFYRPGDTPALWAILDKELSPEYIWCDILTDPGPMGRRVGFWRRTLGPLPDPASASLTGSEALILKPNH